MKATTRDVGLALLDFMEGQYFSVFTEDTPGSSELTEHHSERIVEVIDVSDPSNPFVVLDNGQQFQIRIFAS